MIQWAWALCLAAAAPAGAEGFSEGMSLGDFTRTVRRDPLLRSRASALRERGILGQGESLNEQLDGIEGAAEGEAPPSRPLARSTRPPSAGGALSELRGLPGARSVAPPDLDSESVLAYNQQGQLVERADEEALRRVVDEIVAQYVVTAAGRPAVRHLLLLAARARPEGLAAMTGEARGLFMHLRDQVAARLDPQYPRQPTGFWTIHWDSSLNGKIIATYLNGKICVGPTYESFPFAFQVTVMTHEMLHAFEDGAVSHGPGSTDGSAISVNRFSGSSSVNPDSGIPRERNASEALAYADMTQWLHAL